MTAQENLPLCHSLLFHKQTDLRLTGFYGELTNSGHNTDAGPQSRIVACLGYEEDKRQLSSSGRLSSPPPINVITAMPATYTHQDTITMTKTENIPRLRLPRTTVIVLSKLVRGGRGGACCLSPLSMLARR